MKTLSIILAALSLSACVQWQNVRPELNVAGDEQVTIAECQMKKASAGGYDVYQAAINRSDVFAACMVRHGFQLVRK